MSRSAATYLTAVLLILAGDAAARPPDWKFLPPRTVAIDAVFVPHTRTDNGIRHLEPRGPLHLVVRMPARWAHARIRCHLQEGKHRLQVFDSVVRVIRYQHDMRSVDLDWGDLKRRVNSPYSYAPSVDCRAGQVAVSPTGQQVFLTAELSYLPEQWRQTDTNLIAGATLRIIIRPFNLTQYRSGFGDKPFGITCAVYNDGRVVRIISAEAKRVERLVALADLTFDPPIGAVTEFRCQ